MSEVMLVTEGTRPAVRLERRLTDPPELVWAALTEREQLRTWFPCDVIVDRWEPGAEISFVFPAEAIDMTLSGEVIEVDQPRLLVFTWGEETLRFELSPDAAGTLLALTDELPPSAAARNAAGWESCLDRLAGIESPSETWSQRFAAHAKSFEPRIGHQDGPPAGYKGKLD
jgi:uncharacterized protein YndB with AHSA1/START domain